MPHTEKTLNRTERLFALILLLQNKPNLTTRDLAEHFGVSRRTIFRDLRALAESGVPLTYADSGGYEILEGYQIPPLMFSLREAATLLLGTSFAKQQSDPSVQQEAEQVALKIRAVLPSPVQDYIDRLQQSLVLDPYFLGKGHVPDETQGRWHELSGAIAERHPVFLEYYVESRDEVTKRKVEPLGLVHYFDHWNLIGHCHLRKGVRNFRLDHIRKMFVLSERFNWPEGFDLKEFLRADGSNPTTYRITLTFADRIYRWARPRIPAEIEEERPVDGGTRVTFYFENLDYVAQWLLSFGTEARVEEPEALQQKLLDKARALASQYENAEATA